MGRILETSPSQAGAEPGTPATLDGSPGARTPCLIFDRSWGLGDDLMVFWSIAALSVGQPPAAVPVFFRRAETRRFLAALAPHFPEIDLAAPGRRPGQVVFVRSRPPLLLYPGRPLINVLRARASTRIGFREPTFHRSFQEGRGRYRPTRLLAGLIGAAYMWLPPYPEIYDGLQELAIARRLSKTAALDRTPRLGAAWSAISDRVRGAIAPSPDVAGRTLVFPGAGSFQDFPDEFLEELKRAVPGLAVARFRADGRAAELRYGSLTEAAALLAGCRAAVTTDSAISHLAQFVAQRHLLICTRSRPANVCFPAARHTRVLDLGRALACRPCAYRPLDAYATCASGRPRCAPLTGPELRDEQALRSSLEWLSASPPALLAEADDE